MSDSLPATLPRELVDATLALPPEARATLVDVLLCTLDCPMDPEIEKAWAAEIKCRIEAYEKGDVESHPGELVLAELRAKYPKGAE